MKAARVIAGAIVAYPYLLRPTAKQAHPEVSPLPGSWEQCSPEQLAALECVWVQTVARPAVAREGTPVLVDGQWRQNWIEPPEYDPQTHQCSWDGAQWVVSVIPPPPVPESVPAHHLRRALRQFGMIAGVNAYMAALPDDDEMRESWEYAPHFRRDALGIEAARVALGLTVGQVDALFVAAGQIIT